MNATLDCAEARISLGVYVLGAITPDERSAVDTHLSACAECRSELSDLNTLPALLAKLTPEDASALTEQDPAVPPSLSAVPPPRSADPEQSAPSPESLSVARNSRNKHGKLRIALASTAAAILLVLACLAGTLLGSHHAQPVQTVNNGTALGPWQTATGTSPAGAHATVRYRPMDWGTQVAVLVTGIPPHTKCSIEAIAPDNSTTTAGSWTTDSNEGKVWYPAGTALSSNHLSKFEITVAGQPNITI